MAARRVLVTDSDERSALAACRGLAAAGFDVTAGVSVRPSPGAWSRSVRRRVRLPEPRLDEAAFVAALERELRKQPHDVLLCATEAAALAVSAHRDRVEGLCRHGLPSHDVLERCLEKGELLEIAAAAGLDAPPSSLCESAEEAQRAAARFGFPAMVKPHRSLTGFGTSRAHASSVVIESPEALADAVARFGLPLVVQRREAGAAIYSVGGVFAGGRLLASAVSHYVRTWPRRAGSASFSETVDAPPSLLTRVERLLSLLGYEGLFEVELIVVDSEFATIDFNPRIYGSMALAEAAGANLAAIWCDHLLDGGAATTAARAGVRYRFDDAEARNALFALRRGRLGEFLGICRPRARVTHAYFRWSDPGPFAGRVAQLCWNGLRRARPRTAAPGDPLGFRVRVQTLAAEAFHWLLAYAVGVPLVLLARLARLLKHAGASR